MDRRGALLAFGLILTACSGGAANDVAPPPAAPEDFIELSWLSADADPIATLTVRPARCVASSGSGDAVRLGEIAFESSGLLGGQAARAGLSCESCHRNGRGHPDFFLAGVSDQPGRADVTNAFLGPGRADGTPNPQPIPDLASDADRDFLKTASTSDAAAFVLAQVTEEFDAPEPPEAILDGVAAYLVAIAPDACASEPEPVTWRRDYARALDAARFAQAAAGRGDDSAKVFLLNAAREALGRLHERYPQADVRAALRTASGRLARARSGDVADAVTDVLALEPLLDREAAASYYDAATLKAALGR